MNFRFKQKIEISGKGHTTSFLVDVPVKKVWDVWTKPEHISIWWGPDGFTNTIQIMNVVPNGEWLFIMHGPDGNNYPNKTIFREVIEHKRIVHEHFNPNFISIVEFEDQNDKTLIRWSKEYETKELFDLIEIQYKANEGFYQTVEKLTYYLSSMKL